LLDRYLSTRMRLQLPSPSGWSRDGRTPLFS